MLDCGGVLMSVERLFWAWGYYVYEAKLQKQLIFDAWKKLPKRTLGDGAAEDTEYSRCRGND